MDLKIEMPTLPAFVARFEGAPPIIKSEMVAAMDRTTEKGRNLSRRLSRPKRSGKLMSGIVNEPAVFAGHTVTGAWKATTSYSRPVEEGHRAFGPSTRKYLKFTVGGKTVFTKHVRATTGRWFMKRGGEQIRPEANRQFRAAAARIIARIRGAG